MLTQIAILQSSTWSVIALTSVIVGLTNLANPHIANGAHATPTQMFAEDLCGEKITCVSTVTSTSRPLKDTRKLRRQSAQ